MAYIASDVQARAEALLGGGADAEKRTALGAVCPSALAQLTARLLDGMTPEDVGDVFVTACAMLALSMCAESGSGDISSFSAGSVSVTKRRGGTAAAMRCQAEELLRGYISDGGFAFTGVRG
jgi:hypothetical protein